MSGRRADGPHTKQFDVDIVAKQADERLVTGIVMRPLKVDLQQDWATPAQIEAFADGFEALLENDSASGGLMHSVFPDEWFELVSNGIYGKVFPEDAPIPDDVATFGECTDWAEGQDDIDDPEEFCGFYHIPEEDLEEGDWIQTWRIHDDDLWQLVEDDIVSGFSIGARDVEWRGPMDVADGPDALQLPPEVAEDEPVYEIVDGVIREVSLVDIPAVPDAQILAKDDADKRLGDYLGDQEAFIEEALDRGHSEADAERLWAVMNEAAQVEGADTPGKSLFERAGKAFLGALKGDADAGSDDATGAEHQTRMDTDADKEGRTLSRQNRESLFATIDASLDVLEDAGVDHGMERFTDRDDTAFDLTEHTARSWGTENAADTDDDTQTMTDDSTTDDDGLEDAPAWAKSLQSTVEQNAEQIEEVKADLVDDADDESDKSTEDADADDGKDADADTEDEPPEWAKNLQETVESNSAAIEQIGKQSGVSTQLSGDGSESEADGAGEKSLDDLTGALS